MFPRPVDPRLEDVGVWSGRSGSPAGGATRAQRPWATDANEAATRSVSTAGAPRPQPIGIRERPPYRSRVDASARTSSSNSCVRLRLFVQLIRTAPMTRTTATKPSDVVVRRRCACMERDPNGSELPRAQDSLQRRNPAPAGPTKSTTGIWRLPAGGATARRASSRPPSAGGAPVSRIKSELQPPHQSVVPATPTDGTSPRRRSSSRPSSQSRAKEPPRQRTAQRGLGWPLPAELDGREAELHGLQKSSQPALAKQVAPAGACLMPAPPGGSSPCPTPSGSSRRSTGTCSRGATWSGCSGCRGRGRRS